MKKVIKGILVIALIGSIVSQRPEKVCGTYTFYAISEKQQKSNWCWIATARGIARGEKTVRKSQSDGVIAVKGSNVNEGGKASDIEKGAEYFANGLNFTVLLRELTYYEIVNKINSGHLIGVTWGYYVNGMSRHGHAIYIVGYNNNNGAQKVEYCETLSGDIKEMEYSDLVSDNISGETRKYERSIYVNFK